MDYRGRIYLEDQIKEFPRGERQDKVDEWKQTQLSIFGNVTMSQDKIYVSNVVGPVNIKTRLGRVSQVVNDAPSLDADRKDQFAHLLQELKSAVEQIEWQKFGKVPYRRLGDNTPRTRGPRPLIALIDESGGQPMFDQADQPERPPAWVTGLLSPSVNSNWD